MSFYGDGSELGMYGLVHVKGSGRHTHSTHNISAHKVSIGTHGLILCPLSQIFTLAVSVSVIFVSVSWSVSGADLLLWDEIREESVLCLVGKSFINVQLWYFSLHEHRIPVYNMSLVVWVVKVHYAGQHVPWLPCAMKHCRICCSEHPTPPSWQGPCFYPLLQHYAATTVYKHSSIDLGDSWFLRLGARRKIKEEIKLVRWENLTF